MAQWVQHLLYTLCLNTHSLDKAGYSYVHLQFHCSLRTMGDTDRRILESHRSAILGLTIASNKETLPQMRYQMKSNI